MRSTSGSIYGSWLPGLILILLGGIFLAQNYFGSTLRNWWALFILIPALSTLATAYALWRDGHPDWATGPFIAGLGFLLLTAAFLLDLPIGQLWPLFLITAGVGLLFGRGRRGWY
ncbi:MAG TPA: hypothetical protein VIN70_12365 [Candidatus Limnocylindria bacterium]